LAKKKTIMKYPVLILAQTATYDCGAYNAGAFGTGSCATTAPATAGGTLADTGYDVIVPMALAGAIIVASCIYIVKRFLRRKR
jgi:hypothetical protein